MITPFRCDCGRLLEAADENAGPSMRCPVCGRTVLVPGQPAPVPNEPSGQPEATQIQPWTRRRRLVFWSFLTSLVAGLFALVGFVISYQNRQVAAEAAPSNEVEDDPRLTFPTPFRNTRPDVAYVSDSLCADCHPNHAEWFHQHPMGRSLGPVASVAALQRYDPAVHNPFAAEGATFEVVPHGDRIFHKEIRRDSHGKVFAEALEEVQYVIGSGEHNYSYLIDRKGFLVESPITFYSQKAIWDVSPGFENYRRNVFERPIVPECLFCHSNRVVPVPDTLNRYEQPVFRNGTAIGCQRCHGPGALHVERRERDEVVKGMDDTIFNPKRLEEEKWGNLWELRDGVCQQCHLEGVKRILKRGREFSDYRPGLPWQMFWTVFVRNDTTDDSKFVGSVEQFYSSRCFRASKGKMFCTTCHDPHRLPDPAEKVKYYRNRCAQCHDPESGCNLPLAVRKQKSKDNDCRSCHMPTFGSSDIPHTAITDHRIPRKPSVAADEGWRPLDGPPMGPFLPEVAGYKDREANRARALIMIDRGGRMGAQMALPLLDQHLKNWPDDWPALDAKAEGLHMVGRSREALRVCGEILAKLPRRETTLQQAAVVARALGQRDEAVSFRRRLLQVNPTSLFHRVGLATALAERGDWQQAAAECETILRQYPPNLEARLLLLRYYVRQGDRALARKLFDEVLALKPPEADRLRWWYEEQMK